MINSTRLIHLSHLFELSRLPPLWCQNFPGIVGHSTSLYCGRVVPPSLVGLDDTLVDYFLEPGSLSIYWKALCNFGMALTRAYRMPVVFKNIQISGIYPLDQVISCFMFPISTSIPNFTSTYASDHSILNHFEHSVPDVLKIRTFSFLERSVPGNEKPFSFS